MHSALHTHALFAQCFIPLHTLASPIQQVGGASLAADKFTRIFSYQPLPGPRRLYAHDAVECDNNLGESVVWSQRLQRLFWVSGVWRGAGCWGSVKGVGSW